MSLDMNWGKVKDVSELHGSENEWYTTQSIGFLTMAIGMNKITEKNVDEFVMRCRLHEKIIAPLRRDFDGKPIYVTKADVVRRIGFGTNASTMTAAQFRKQLVERVERDCRYSIRNDGDKTSPQIIAERAAKEEATTND